MPERRSSHSKLLGWHFAHCGYGFQLNVTVTTRLLFSKMLQLWPLVESHPTHPPNVDPKFGAAVIVSCVPEGKVVAH